MIHSGHPTQLAGKRTRIQDVVPIKHGDIPASYVSLPGGKVINYSLTGDFVDVTVG